MKISKGKIVSASKAELVKLYIERGYEDILTFGEFEFYMQQAGCEVEEET